MTRLCGITDCTNPGEWREHPSRFDRSKTLRLFLCDLHDQRLLERGRRFLAEFPSTARLEQSIAAHPSNYPFHAHEEEFCEHPDCVGA